MANPSLSSVVSTAKRKRHFWLFPLLTSLFIVVSFAVLFIPQAKSLVETREEIETTTNQLKRLEAKRLALEDLASSGLDQQLKLAEQVVPSRKPVMELMTLVETYAKENEVEIVGYEFNPGTLASASASPKGESEEDGSEETVDEPPPTASSKKQGELDGMLIALHVEGMHEKIQTFFERLEKMGPLTQLDVVELTLEQLEPIPGEEPLQQGAIKVSVIYALPLKSLSSPETPLDELDQGDLDMLKKLEALETVEDLDLPEIPEATNSGERPNPFGY